MVGKTVRAFPVFPKAETLRVADFSRRSRAPPCHAGRPPTKPTASEEPRKRTAEPLVATSTGVDIIGVLMEGTKAGMLFEV